MVDGSKNMTGTSRERPTNFHEPKCEPPERRSTRNAEKGDVLISSCVGKHWSPGIRSRQISFLSPPSGWISHVIVDSRLSRICPGKTSRTPDHGRGSLPPLTKSLHHPLWQPDQPRIGDDTVSPGKIVQLH